MKVSLLFGLLLASASVQAQTTFTVDGTQYKVTGSNTVELVKGDTKATEVVIPASVTYNGKEYAVKSIGEESYLWTSANSITIPASVDTIKAKAFYYGKPTTIHFSEGLKYIGKSAFGGVGCTELEIPASVTKIEGYAFFSSSSLKKLTLHEGLKVIGPSAFYHPKALESLTIPATVDTIGSSAFAMSDKLTSLKLNEGLKYIGNFAFGQSALLTSVSLPSTLTALGDEVFLKCAKLTEVTLPAKLTKMGTSVFAKTAIATFKVDAANETFKVKDGCVYSSDENVLYAVPMTGKSSLVVSSKCLGVNGGAAWGSKIESLRLPSGLLAIDDYAFEEAPIVQLNIPSSVTYVGEQAFALTKVKRLVVPGNVAFLGDGAFAKCDSLAEVTLPSSVTAMENHLFFRDAKLQKMTVLSNTAPDILEGYYEDYDVAFYGIGSGAKLYVPKGASQSYKDKSWSDYFTIEELPTGLFSPVSTDPATGAKLGKYAPLSFKITFDRAVSVTNDAPDVSVRKTSLLYSNLFTPDDSWKVNLSSDKKSITVWASDYDGYTESFNFDTSDIYYLTVPASIVKDADGNVNDRIVLTFNQPTTTAVESVATATTKGEPVERFNLSGQKLSAPQHGVNIVRYSDGTTRKVIVK